MFKGCKRELEERQRRSPDGGLSCTQGRRDITTGSPQWDLSHRSDVINSISLFREMLRWNKKPAGSQRRRKGR